MQLKPQKCQLFVFAMTDKLQLLELWPNIVMILNFKS